jgi:hypothetical protein
LYLLLEKDVVIICKKGEAALVQELVSTAQKEYEAQYKQSVSVTIHQSKFLPDTTSVGSIRYPMINRWLIVQVELF